MPILGTIASSIAKGIANLNYIWNAASTNADFGSCAVNPTTGSVGLTFQREYSGYGYIPASFLVKNDGSLTYQKKVRQVSSAKNTYTSATILTSTDVLYQVGSDSDGFGAVNAISATGSLVFQKRESFNGAAASGWYNGDVDTSGNLYVSGAGPSNYNYFPVAKYNTSGTVQWATRWTDNSSAGSHNATSFCIGGGNTIYSAGKRFAGGYDTVIARINTSDGTINGNGAKVNTQTSDKAMTYDPVNDKVYMIFNKASYFVLVQFAPNLQSHSQTSNSVGSTNAVDVKCDSSGNIYVFCYSYSDNANMETSVFKYNSTLTLQWVRGFKNNNTYEEFAGDGKFSGGIIGSSYVFGYNLRPDSSGSTRSVAFQRFPTDGTKTGTYSWNQENGTYGSYTYSNLDSFLLGNNQSVSISNGISMTTASLTLGNQTIDQSEITNTTFTTGYTTV